MRLNENVLNNALITYIVLDHLYAFLLLSLSNVTKFSKDLIITLFLYLLLFLFCYSILYIFISISNMVYTAQHNTS